MEKEEIIDFLKENLSISLDTDSEYTYGGMRSALIVSLKLGDEVISKESISLPT